MKGYLLKEETITTGEGSFFESNAAENNYVVIFEDDSETGYFYAAERNPDTGVLSILDMVFIYSVENIPEANRKQSLSIIWSTDWQRCGLILEDTCHAVFDFENKAGYNLTGFPPPILWTIPERTLTQEMISRFFK